jgi:hypothetical protein
MMDQTAVELIEYTAISVETAGALQKETATPRTVGKA